MLPIKRFFLTYKKILKIAYQVSPRLLITVIASNAFWGLTNLPVLYINKTLIDVVVNNLKNPDISNALRTIAILAFSRGFLELIRSGLSRINWTLSISLTDRLHFFLNGITSQKLNSLDIPTVESPDFQDRYKKVERIGNNSVWGMIEPLSNIPNAVFTILSGIIPIISFNPLIALAVIIVSIPDILLSSRIIKRDYEAEKVLDPKYRIINWVYWHLVDAKNYYENRVLGATKFLVNKMTLIADEINNHRYQRRMNRARLRFFGDIPSFLLSTVLNVYFFSLALVGRISLGTAQLLYSAIGTLDNGVTTFVNSALGIYENYLIVNDLNWFLELESKSSNGKKEPSSEFKKGVEFRSVWFKYPSSKKWILKNINFTLKPKENIALVGENGAGKTTLIKLLCGFYLPTKGEILVNGVNILSYDQAKYWRSLGVLFQDFSHYPFSARESIGIGNTRKISDVNRVRNAAKLTGVDRFIEGLALGYRTPLAKEFTGGVDPSRGQWQRIALARILFRDSKIIILDEPTSNVDPKAEEEIFDKIIELTKNEILILISHRFSTVRKADRILNMDDGKIIEQGTHDELMERKGEYASLFKLQAKGYQ